MPCEVGSTIGPENAAPVMVYPVAWVGTWTIASAPGCAFMGPILHDPADPDMRTMRSNSPSARNRW